jgi:hypothetical protein
MTEEADIKVVSMKEWCRNDSLVSMLEIMLEGTFLLLGDDNDPPQLGVMKTDNMGGNVFTVVGALEKIKLQLLDEIESE